MSMPRNYWAPIAWTCNVLCWVFLVLWVGTTKQPSDVTFLVCCSLISACTCFVVINPWNNNLCEPFKLVAFLYGWSFGLGPLLLASEGLYQFEYLGSSWERLLSEGAFLAFIGLLALGAGFYSCSFFAKTDIEETPRSLCQKEREALTVAGTGIFLVGGAAYLGLVYEAGGFTHFFFYTGGRADIFNGVFGGLYWASFFLISGLCVIGCAHVKDHPVFVMILALFVGVAFIPFQGREEVIAPVICGVLLLHYGHKRIGVKWMALTVCLLLVVASFLAYFRSSEKAATYRNTNSFVSTYSDQFGVRILDTLAKNIEQMDAFLITIRYVEKTHRTLGGNTLLNWLEPLNRHVFGGALESEHSGRFMTILINPEHRWSHTALSPSILGELYLNFAIPGVLVGLLLYGGVLRLLQEKISEVQYAPVSLMLYPYPIWIISKAVIDGTVHLFRPLIVAIPILILYVIFMARFAGSRLPVTLETASADQEK